MKHALTLLLFALPLAACGGDPADAPEDRQHDAVHEATVPGEPVEARVEDGVQVVEVEIGRMGYRPARIALQPGVPARLVFTRTVEGDCASQVAIPAFDVPATDLPMNEPVAVAFTPDESGEFTFVCGMGMMSGALLVRS